MTETQTAEPQVQTPQAALCFCFSKKAWARFASSVGANEAVENTHGSE
jgi:hypothetical protein